MAYTAGAGLPSIERLFIKYILVPFCRTFFTWNIALYMIQREVRIITKLVNSIDNNLLQKRVMIDRTFAIEDHSRDFSINMVLEHLTIANGAIMSLIQRLSNNEYIKEQISIESVKPKENKKEQLKEFVELMDRYSFYIKQHNKVYSKATMRHPWFVEFNNFDWSIFNYMHTFIHRRQIEAIISKLKENDVN
jgi:hypothetical protein